MLTSTPFHEPFPGAEPFEFVTWQADRGEVWLRLSGELDIASVTRLDRPLNDALASADSVVVDLRQLSFIDGAGLGALLSARARASAGGRRLKLVRGAQQFDALLGVTGLAELFETVDSGASEREGPLSDDGPMHLHCPRCDLTIRVPAGHPAPEHCPRCLGRNGLEIPMYATGTGRS